MRRCVLVIFLVLVFVSLCYCREYRSRFGFVVEIPDHWMVVTGDEVREDSRWYDLSSRKEFRNWDKGLLREMMGKVRSGDLEFYFNMETSDGFFMDNINVIRGFGRVPENEVQLARVCGLLPGELFSDYGRRLRVYRCLLRDVNGMRSLYLEYDGVIDGTRVIQYQIQRSSVVVITFTATCKVSVLDEVRREFDRIVYSVRFLR